MVLGVVAWIGIATAVFVGVNIGGSSTGVAFGPATGAGVLGKRTSQALMAVFVLADGLPVENAQGGAHADDGADDDEARARGDARDVPQDQGQTGEEKDRGRGAGGEAVAGHEVVAEGLDDVGADQQAAGVAIGVGAFAIGGRTMDTVGNEIAEIPLEGWVFVNVLAAAIITGLSWLGIPASLALTLQVCVMGFGWGHTTRELSLLHSLGYPPRTAEERVHMASDQMDAYNVDTTRRILTVWLITPVIAGALAFAFFLAGARFGWLV